MQVHQELLWVWPEPGADAHLEAMSQPAPLIPMLSENKAIHVAPWSVCLSYLSADCD